MSKTKLASLAREPVLARIGIGIGAFVGGESRLAGSNIVLVSILRSKPGKGQRQNQHNGNDL